jgi:ATP-binding cassette subfamily B protein
MNGNPLAYLYVKTWHYSEGNRKSVVWFWSMFVISESIEVLIYPFIWAKIMRVIQEKGITDQSFQTLMILLGAILASTLTVWAIHGPARFLESVNAFLVRLNYRKFLLRGVMTFPMDWHADHHSGDTIDKIEKGTGGMYRFSESSFQIIYSIVKLILSYSMLVYFFPPSGVIVFIMMVLIFLVVTRFDRILVTQYEVLNQNENDVTAKVFDSISNITTVIILRVERLVFDAIIKKAESPFKLYKRNIFLNELKWFLVAFLCTVTVVFVMGAYFYRHYGAVGGVLVGNVYLLYRYLGNITDIFERFTYMYGDVLQQRARVTNSEEISNDFVGGSFSNHVLSKDWKQLEINNLSFSYGGEQSLKNVSLSLKRGMKYAFVGKSGSGKTTMLHLMRDLYHPSTLDLSVDGQNIPCGFEGISRAIALIPQSPEIFAGTILVNLTLGATYSDKFVRHYTDLACFSEVVDALPNGLESVINEKGVNLSGGQKQRLALARGLIASHGKDIVLLDEPTSSLDWENQAKFFENIFLDLSGKTIVSSLHSLHLLPLFDIIYVLDEGKIVGSGTLSELLNGCPEFVELWQQKDRSSEDV